MMNPLLQALKAAGLELKQPGQPYFCQFDKIELTAEEMAGLCRYTSPEMALAAIAALTEGRSVTPVQGGPAVEGVAYELAEQWLAWVRCCIEQRRIDTFRW